MNLNLAINLAPPNVLLCVSSVLQRLGVPSDKADSRHDVVVASASLSNVLYSGPGAGQTLLAKLWDLSSLLTNIESKSPYWRGMGGVRWESGLMKITWRHWSIQEKVINSGLSFAPMKSFSSSFQGLWGSNSRHHLEVEFAAEGEVGGLLTEGLHHLWKAPFSEPCVGDYSEAGLHHRLPMTFVEPELSRFRCTELWV